VRFDVHLPSDRQRPIRAWHAFCLKLYAVSVFFPRKPPRRWLRLRLLLGLGPSPLSCSARCHRQPWNCAMAYVLRAIVPERGDRFTVEYKTKRAALEGARALRDDGILVTIAGPDGKPVDETKEE
jgi:hypothetical protein